jgi:hypothetical protein
VWGQTAAPDATSANAAPKFEYFAGASFSGVFSGMGPVSLFGPNLASAFSTRDSQQGGFGASAIRNLGPHLGVKVDFSEFVRTQRGAGLFNDNLQAVNVRSRQLNFLLGPEWKWRNRTRFTPWVHALGGAAVVHSNYQTFGNGLSFTSSDTRVGGTLAAGGGVDFRVARHAGFRVGADYMPVFLGAPFSDPSRVQQQVRLTLGVIGH